MDKNYKSTTETSKETDAGSGNYSTKDNLQKDNAEESLNVHTNDAAKESGLNEADKPGKHEADSGADAAGTMGTKPD
jgi:hypothetical protein